MDSQEFSCAICFIEYNAIDRVPRNLPNCGHSFCSPCLEELIRHRNPAACPLDRKTFSVRNGVTDLPINMPLKQILEMRSQQKICQLHQEEATLICVTDKSRICTQCAYSNDHKGHEIKHIK